MVVNIPSSKVPLQAFSVLVPMLLLGNVVDAITSHQEPRRSVKFAGCSDDSAALLDQLPLYNAGNSCFRCTTFGASLRTM